jgi:hypothetical protein
MLVAPSDVNMVGEHKGSLLKEFEGAQGKVDLKKRNRMIIVMGSFPLIFVFMLFFEGIPEDEFLRWMMIILFAAMVPFDLLFVNHLVIPIVAPMDVYSNGIERKQTFVERLFKVQEFSQKVDIDHLDFNETYVVGRQKNYHIVSVSLTLKNGKKKKMGNRNPNQAREIASFLKDKLALNVIWSGQGPVAVDGHAHKVRVSSTQEVPSSQNSRCIQCGQPLESGADFCVKCGEKKG